MTPPASTGKAARRQMEAALFVLSAMMLVLVSLALLTRSPAVADWFDRKEEASCRQTKRILKHCGWFQEPYELWMYDRLPPADYAKGGVYFVGASCVELATKLWELPPETQALVHNYGMVASNPKADSVLLRYLIDQRRILRAGPEKTLVVLGASIRPTFLPSRSLPPAWCDGWERHGLFVCDPQEGIRAVPRNPIAKFVEFEETFQAAFTTRLEDIFHQQLIRWRHHGVEPADTHNPALYADVRRQEMGPDWRREIKESVQVFGETLDYLAAQHVQIRVVLMPDGSWENDMLPYKAEFGRELAALCAEKHVAMFDWSRLLADDEFADMCHATIDGMDKTQSAFLEIALPFLRSTKALPAAPSAKDPSANQL